MERVRLGTPLRLAVALLVACGPPTPTDTSPTPVPTPPVVEAVVVPVFDAFEDGVVISASVDAADGAVFFAVESAPTLFARPDVDLVRFAGPDAAREVFRLSTDRLVTEVGHLPVVLAEPDAPVRILTKESESQAQATLELYTFDDAVTGPESVRPPTPYRAGRMQMVADPTTDVLHLCWRGTTDGEEDVFGLSAVDAAAMQAIADDTLVAEPGIVEDHCDIALDATGTRFTVFHRREGAADTVVLQVTGPGAPTPSASGVLTLPAGVSGADFPTLAADGTQVIAAAAGVQGERTAITVWDCPADCDEPDAFSASTIDPPGDVHVQVRAVLADGHALLFYKSRQGDREQVAMSSRCAGASEWTHHAALVETPDTAFSTIAGGSPRTVVYDPATATLHAALVQRQGLVEFGLLGWSAPLALYCE